MELPFLLSQFNFANVGNVSFMNRDKPKSISLSWRSEDGKNSYALHVL